MNLNTLQGGFSEAKQIQRTVRKGSISCCIHDVCAVSKSTVILVVVQSMSPRDCAENSISTYLRWPVQLVVSSTVCNSSHWAVC